MYPLQHCKQQKEEKITCFKKYHFCSTAVFFLIKAITQAPIVLTGSFQLLAWFLCKMYWVV